MDFKDVLNLFFERSNALQPLWSFYTTVVLALIAFFSAIKPSEKIRVGAVIFSIVFVVLAWANLDALLTVTRQRLAAVSLLKDTSKLSNVPDKAVVNALLGGLEPSSVRRVVIGHVAADFFVLAMIWMLAVKKA